MFISRIVTDIIPQGLEGQRVADEYEKSLRVIDAFRERKEETKSIYIKYEYVYEARINEKGEIETC